MLAATAVCASQAQAPSKHAKEPARARARATSEPARRQGSAGKEARALRPASRVRERVLAKLARRLHEKPSAASYRALSAFARENTTNVLGPRTALALGYYDVSRDKPDLALTWFRRAAGESLLREYVLYWESQAYMALGRQQEALADLERAHREYPRSVMNDQIVTSLAQAALAVGKPEVATVDLDGYSRTASRPDLLLLRGQAREQLAAVTGQKPLAAAADYLRIYYHFPLNDEADIAGQKISVLKAALGDQFPATLMQERIARAESFYLARRWDQARTEYSKLIPELNGVNRQRAELRVAQCAVRTGGSPDLLTAVQLTDPELDAERLYALSLAQGSQNLEEQMLAEIDGLAKRFPQSSWLEQGLFAAGNYYWVNLDRDKAADLYQRLVGLFPEGKNTSSAAWRIAWTAYLQRKPDSTDMLEAYLRRFPSSDYVPDALYFLGRSNERAGKLAHARGLYLAATTRFPLSYFGLEAAKRIRPAPEGIGRSPAISTKFLSVIPDPPPVRRVTRRLHIPAPAEAHVERARALSSIAFDASAELEYRAAYTESRSRQLLLDAATAAQAAGRYSAGIFTIRELYPEMDQRNIREIPKKIWQMAFPRPYSSGVESLAAHYHLDPMLIEGLIRQESAFNSDALSRSGAVGLMQLMPATGRRVARQLGLRYSRSRLNDPSYNLRLGSRYLATLMGWFKTPEEALAAYNAGENRVTQWTDGQNYQEMAEFVESIPFTQTRNYVKIVMRNADVYRQVYGRARPQSRRPGRAPARTEKKRPVRTEKKR